ncbi:riboflavin synthase [Alphaproteobacteria bacterium]|nr:riboflavin synthase [Alphaproteobacteria bacterium]
MFSGIISAIGVVKNITHNQIHSIDIEIKQINIDDFEKPGNLIKIGCSIACSGVCLTLTKKRGNILTFDVSAETMNKTNLSNWKIGNLVNLERSLRVGDEIGGHFVTGHVDTVLELKKIVEEDGSKILYINLNKQMSPYIASKGSITIEGISLTVNDVNNEYFNVNVIPFTWNNTNLRNIKVNDFVNVEIDLLSRYLINYQNKKEY